MPSTDDDTSVGTPDPRLTFEEIPGGRYEIVELIGVGAFGSVYKALDTFLNRFVAIKSIRLDPAVDPSHRSALSKRFIREAQVAAQLQHNHIVTIHDIVFTPAVGFIVMEFIQGETLQGILSEKRIPLSRIVDLVAQIARGLEYAHERKVIHRDVKPGNIMITPSFEARITDFGIAKSDGATHLTMSGSLIGTPDYMSPEQATGEEVDCRTDLFSLGCVFYECFTGRKPFPGSSLTAVLLSIVNDDPLESPAFKALTPPPEVTAFLERALHKRKTSRFEDASQLLEALSAIPVDVADDSAPDLSPLSPADKEKNARRTGPTLQLVSARSPDRDTLESLRAETRSLRFTRIASDEFQMISLTPAQGFILSRINGMSRASDILSVSPMPESEAAGTLLDLIDKGLLTWAEPTQDPTIPETNEVEGKPLEPAMGHEVDRAIRLGSERRYSELLGIDISTPKAEVKKSYLELVQRFHPDAQAYRVSSADRQRLTRVCAVLTEALNAVTPRKVSTTLPTKERVASSDTARIQRQSYASKLFGRAQEFFAARDYWEAIQLSRQASELDPENAAYHHLLGLGLMKNQNWMKEAEEMLEHAFELAPDNDTYRNDLASLYDRQGLADRAAALREHAEHTAK